MIISVLRLSLRTQEYYGSSRGRALGKACGQCECVLRYYYGRLMLTPPFGRTLRFAMLLPLKGGSMRSIRGAFIFRNRGPSLKVHHGPGQCLTSMSKQRAARQGSLPGMSVCATTHLLQGLPITENGSPTHRTHRSHRTYLAEMSRGGGSGCVGHESPRCHPPVEPLVLLMRSPSGDKPSATPGGSRGLTYVPSHGIPFARALDYGK
jgi:hypothetical protein